MSSPAERANHLKKQGRCFNCLKNHLSRECRSREKCVRCRGKHHNALCRGERQGDRQAGSNNRAQGGAGQQRQKPPAPARDGEESTPTNNLYAGSGSPVLLQTAVVKVFKPDSQSSHSKPIRAILDSGSQRSYLTQAVAHQLDLHSKREESLNIKTFGEAQGSHQTCQVVDLAIQANGGGTITMEALVVPIICDALANQPTKATKLKHPHLKGLRLADYHSKEEQLPVDLLVGSDNYWKLVTGNVRRGKTGPTAIQTRVGWVLSGNSEVLEDSPTANLLFTTTHLLRIQTTPTEDSLDDKLQRFWDLETMGITDEGTSVQEMFNQSIKLQEGRYEVTLPWKPTHRPLPSNLQLCTRRFQTLLKKLQLTPQLLRDYDEVMKEQLQKGIIEEVPAAELDKSYKTHYLPHHPVIRTDKATEWSMTPLPKQEATPLSMTACTQALTLTSQFSRSS